MSSPKPPKVKTKDLNFYEALPFIMEGKSVTKAEWKDRSVYAFLKFGHLSIHRDNQDHDWILTDGDMYGDDYEVL